MDRIFLSTVCRLAGDTSCDGGTRHCGRDTHRRCDGFIVRMCLVMGPGEVSI